MQAAIWIYPWDILDEGARPLMERLARLGYSAVHVAASYHSVQAVLPHNPYRTTILAERAALYFRPTKTTWSGAPIRPAISPMVGAQGDALAAAADACRDLGLRLIAWTVCLHNGDLGKRHPATNVVNLMGEAYRYSLCAANPDVRDFLRRLVSDLGSRCDAVELESPHWMPFPHQQHTKIGVPFGGALRLLLSLCFCHHCRVMGSGIGLDMDAVEWRLRGCLRQLMRSPRFANDGDQIEALLADQPDLSRFLAARQASIEVLVESLVRIAAPKKLYLIPTAPGWLSGADLASLARLVDVVVVPAYGTASHVSRVSREATERVGDVDRIRIGLSLLEPETPDEPSFRAACRAVSDAGITKVTLYNYGLADARRLTWVAAALEA